MLENIDGKDIYGLLVGSLGNHRQKKKSLLDKVVTGCIRDFPFSRETKMLVMGEPPLVRKGRERQQGVLTEKFLVMACPFLLMDVS